jgi:UDP-N-acetylmuramate: L-alanyl-gamma-D-glutamyl-meso-diaminopimelate ligase
MHIHILGICGTFMAGIAVLAKKLGYTVTGSDAATYPPMSTQLEGWGIQCQSGYSPDNLEPKPDLVIIGNALSRGNPEVEAVFNQGLPYISGAQWLFEHVLAERWVLAVAGTHGKTTTASLLAWILEEAGLSPGFLIGGLPENFGVSARLGDKPFFVVEADEYDTAFFDKRSKFVHYRPRTLIVNNLEFDHADIFPDLAAIQQQFHHLIRTVPGNGLIINNHQEVAIDEVLKQGCWTPGETFGNAESDWHTQSLNQEHSHFEVYYQNKPIGTVQWSLIGQYNVHNALSAIAAARHAGVPVAIACEALETFQSVKRRLELRGVVDNISIYDDFAHHPTAIALTIEALRQKVGSQKIIAVLEPRSNTMRMGHHKDQLASALSDADAVALYQPKNINWSLFEMAKSLQNGQIFNDTSDLIAHLVSQAKSGDHILIMSNGGFENIHERLLTTLKSKI